jgi:hypothetical protein
MHASKDSMWRVLCKKFLSKDSMWWVLYLHRSDQPRPSPPVRRAPRQWRALHRWTPRTDESPFTGSKEILRWKRMLQTYVSSVLYRCCKSRSECCTCCNCYTRMFQVYVLNISSISDSRRCCTESASWKHMFQVFQKYVARSVLQK